jgi:hypothetical protein
MFYFTELILDSQAGLGLGQSLAQCAILQEDRERLIAEVAKSDDWPINKDMLIKNTTRHSQNSRKRWIKSKKPTHETE